MINSSVFGKTMEDVIKHRDIKLATTEKRQKMVFLNFMRNRNEKKIQSIQVNQFQTLAKSDGFIFSIETEDVYTDIVKNVETNYEVLLPIRKKVIRLIKDKLGGKIMANFVALRPKM